MFITKSTLFLVFVILGLWAASTAVKALSIGWMPIRFVRVEGNFQYINKAAVKRKLLPLVTTGLFAADIKTIQAETIAMPWVEDVKVKRIWPDTIDVRIFEQQPVARWAEDGLLNVKGEIFKPENIDQFKGLLRIEGPDDFEKRLFEIIKGLQTALADQSLQLREFTVSERRSWRLLLANGTELQLGRVEPLQKFERFLKTLPVLTDNNIDAIEKIHKVDMRYPNGFAITWKPGVEVDWQDVLEKQQIRKKT